MSYLTARKAGLMLCSGCHLLVQPPSAPGMDSLCPRCGEHLHWRKTNSLARTWALVLASIVFYVPANLLPITHIVSLGHRQSDTIMSGVIYFLQTGMWPIALVIFVASVFVPFMKLVILIFLLISVQRGSSWRPRDRTRLYRLTELVGRWSMVDVYVVTILVALVKMGGLATIDAGPGAVYFGMVVVLTMFAAASFDPRLIWDVMESNDG